MSQYKKEDPSSIQAMFGSIAPQYDRTNAILSFQLHRYWNRKLVKSALANNPSVILDLCCGTGEIGYRLLNQLKSPAQLHFLDFCSEMLEQAKKRSQPFKKKHQLDFYCADAQKIPLNSSSVDSVTVAYGIRNVTQPQKCFEDVYRVLRDRGTFCILELTEPQNALLNWGHKIYLQKVLPLIGKSLTSNQAAYQYLCNSIQSFTKPDKVVGMLQNAGFKKVQVIPMTGGIATLFKASKSI